MLFRDEIKLGYDLLTLFYLFVFLFLFFFLGGLLLFETNILFISPSIDFVWIKYGIKLPFKWKERRIDGHFNSCVENTLKDTLTDTSNDQIHLF